MYPILKIIAEANPNIVVPHKFKFAVLQQLIKTPDWPICYLLIPIYFGKPEQFRKMLAVRKWGPSIEVLRVLIINTIISSKIYPDRFVYQPMFNAFEGKIFGPDFDETIQHVLNFQKTEAPSGLTWSLVPLEGACKRVAWIPGKNDTDWKFFEYYTKL